MSLFDNVFVDPNNVKNKLDYPLFYKESFLLFAILVAGKSADTTKVKVNNFIASIIGNERPMSLFDYIINNYSDNDFSKLELKLKENKTGKYSLVLNFFKDIKESKINLMTCSIEDLEKLRGVGKKSSRFFMLYNRKDQQSHAILDTHILKFLKNNGLNVPSQTPSGKYYDELEKEYFVLLEKIKPKMTASELDFRLWYEAKENKKVGKVTRNGKLTFN